MASAQVFKLRPARAPAPSFFSGQRLPSPFPLQQHIPREDLKMPFVKTVKNDAYFSRYQVKYRRRREGKTDCTFALRCPALSTT